MRSTIEITIRRAPAGGFTADITMPGENGAAQAFLAANRPAPLEPAALLGLVNDHAAYGSALTAQLFADPGLREAWLRARAHTAGGAPQLRLTFLGEGSDTLHAIRWEALRDPESNRAIALDERVRLVRTPDSADLTPIAVPPRPDLRALVAVASPGNLGTFGLASVDVAGEVARARAALGDIPATVLGDHPGAPGRATLANLAAQLRAGPPIAILIAHGTLRDGQPYVWLEDDDGQGDRVAGSALVEAIAGLSARPLLLILASCQSAGSGYEERLGALGLQLARAGIPAVIGFQDDVAMGTIKALLPALIEELRRDGQIDRALAAARAALGESGPWWQPVLWLRTDGRLWREDPPASAQLPHTLPPQRQLVGRGQDVAALVALLQRPDIRLVTLVGTGGIGKTALAVNAAHALLDAFPDGAHFVPLEHVGDAALVLPAIGQALRVDAPLPGLGQALAREIGGRRVLLVLDNFEQVVAAGELLADILRCPNLKILVTSQVSLIERAPYTAVYPVPPLATPAQIERASREEIEASAAVALFREQARRELIELPGDLAHSRLIARICRRLDGLPLAIELAVAFCTTQTLPELATQLDQRLTALSDTRAHRPERHRTLLAMIDWSYQLLSPDEQLAFVRMAVFADGFTPRMAAAVCGYSEAELDRMLRALIARHLIRHVEDRGPAKWFSMLESIHAYAAQMLQQQSDRATLRRRHAQVYLDMATQAKSQAQTSSRDQLAAERANLLAAIDWAITTGAAEMALRFCIALSDYWYDASRTEGRQVIARVLNLVRSDPASVAGRSLEYAKALHVAGMLAYGQGQLAAAEGYYEEGLAQYLELGASDGALALRYNLALIAHQRGSYAQAAARYAECRETYASQDDSLGIADIAILQGDLAYDMGEDQQAEQAYREARRLSRAHGDKEREARALNGLGLLALAQGHHQRAERLCRESYAIAEQQQIPEDAANALVNLGSVELARGDLRQADTHLYDALRRFREVGEQRNCLLCLDGIAELAAAHQQAERAARIWAAVDTARAAGEIVLSPRAVERRRQVIAAAQQGSDPFLWDDAWEEGTLTTIEALIAEELRMHGSNLAAPR